MRQHMRAARIKVQRALTHELQLGRHGGGLLQLPDGRENHGIQRRRHMLGVACTLAALECSRKAAQAGLCSEDNSSLALLAGQHRWSGESRHAASGRQLRRVCSCAGQQQR
jgi:hypothetical protein